MTVFDDRHHTLTHLTRIAQGLSPEEGREWLRELFEQNLEHWAEAALEVAVETGDPVGQVLAEQVAGHGSADLAGRLAYRCNDARHLHSTPLREVALVSLRKVLDDHRARWPEPDSIESDRRASWLNDLGYCMSETGRWEPAIEATREAVELRRQLAASQPADYLPQLALNLHNLGSCWSDLGRHEEALAATREAIDIRRTLEPSERTQVDLAGSLQNLGDDLAAVGRRDEATSAAEEAVEIHRRLAGPSIEHLPRLAGSLSALAGHLYAAGRLDEALAHTEEAVTLRRQLADLRPDAFRADLARSLGHLSVWYGESSGMKRPWSQAGSRCRSTGSSMRRGRRYSGRSWR